MGTWGLSHFEEQSCVQILWGSLYQIGIDRITKPAHANYTYSIVAGMNAGIDMARLFIDGLAYLVKNKFISMSRIDDAVKRILRVEFVMGLFENPLADYSMAKYLGSEKSGLGSCKENARVTEKWNLRRNRCTTILSVVKSAVDSKTQVVFNENPNAEFVKSNKFDYAIVVVGEHPYAETFGDSLNLTILEPGPTTIKNVCGSVKCVVVLITGRPVVVQPYVETIDALVAAWLPGTEGQGETDALFGDYGFTEKLARTWFKSVDQLLMNVGDPHYDPLYPFGFGLTTEAKKNL
ncbi:hypothetical protein L6452_14463 [Arctium lappa]|uniref:Uncharacterized protein n=1 Tax=Arctium lappa TaxID=4217 RepID=A0ACB9CL64_ARCLA|nr:hypothetical protein L6452_14463 [Arctium lappa]